MCSLWQDSGCGSFIKMLTRPHGQWTHCSSCCPLHAELCVSFSFCLSLSLNPALYLSLSMPPSSPSLSSITSMGFDARWNRKPTNTDPFFWFYLPSLAFFSYSPLCPFLFFCAVVTVSVLFSFNLNTFQLCMNWALINLIMFRHANVTALPLHKCVCVFTV